VRGCCARLRARARERRALDAPPSLARDAQHPALPAPAPAADEESFTELFATYFPFVYDVKALMHANGAFHGGLQKLADDLKVVRRGTAHQAGSDSLVTAATFFKLRADVFGGRIDDKAFRCVLYGFS